MDPGPGPNIRLLVFGAVGWTCFFCLQGALNWTRQNRPQYLFFVRYGNPRPSRHPQEAKIQQLRSSFNFAALRETLQCDKPAAHSSLKDLDFAWVGSKRELKALAQLLQSCKVFAVDVEAHSVFTYQAMPCLLQVAVGSHCFVVDLLSLHDCASILKAPFEDSNVLKLFHGCLGDLQWLQQLDIYPVNVLDTCVLAEEAVKVNRVKKPGLGNLLAQLCGVESNKSLAAGDWRTRPLSEEMLFYSVSDVSYLQYIAMTLLDFSSEQQQVIGDNPQVTAPPVDGGAATSKADATCSVSAEKHHEQDTPSVLPALGDKQGSCASGNQAEPSPGSLIGIDCSGQPPSAQTAGETESAGPLDEALDGGTPSHMQRADSLEVTTGPLDEQQLPCSPLAVLSKKNLHGQNSRRSSQATEAADYSRPRELSDCVESTSSAACNTGAEISVDLVDEQNIDSAMSPKSDLKDPEVQIRPSSAGASSRGQQQGGVSDEAVNGPADNSLVHQSSNDVLVTVPYAAAAVPAVATDASGSTLGHADSFAVTGASLLDAEEAPEDAPLVGPVDSSAVDAPVAASSVAGSVGKQKRSGKKEKKKKDSKKQADNALAGEMQPMDVERVWCKSCDRTMIIHREATVAEVSKASMARLVNKEVEYRSKGVLHPTKKHGTSQSPTDPVMFRIVGVACYWRTAVAHFVDISPVMILPDTLVNYILKHRPQGTLAVVSCLLRWVAAHRAKHAERFKREAEAAAAKARGEGVSTGACTNGKSNGKRWGADDRNPFAWYLDNWSPGCATLLATPWLSWLLFCAYNGKTSRLPVQVERMITQQEDKHQPSAGTLTASNTNRPSRKNQGSTSRTTQTDNNGSQDVPGSGQEGTEVPAAAPTQKMTRDLIISKFSKKKPAYSSCRMLSQDGQFLAACDLKKLVWYVNKGLGQWEPGHGKDSTQPTIRLKFQHRTTDKETGDGFYNEVKANECVGCGEAGHYLKYKIVPDCYRKHFPVNMKSHRSHDIVLLCIDCHERAHTSAEALKRHLATVNSIPLQPRSSPIRSDPFLPTPPPEECCSSREDDTEADTVSDITAICTDPTSSETAVALPPVSVCSDIANGHSIAPPADPLEPSGFSAGGCGVEPCNASCSTATAVPACSGETATECAGGVGEDPSSSGAGGDGGEKVGMISGSSLCVRGGGVERVDAVSERMPSPAHVRRVALTLERQPHLPKERRQELEAVVARYVHGPAAAIDQGLAPGDIEAALLAGLAKTKRNQTVTRLMQEGRPPPSGYALSQQEGRVSIISAPHHQGGHMWHGRKVVEKIIGTYGVTGLQELQVEFRKIFVEAVQPKNLPVSWRVHHEAPREFGLHSIFSKHPLQDATAERPPQIFAPSQQENTAQQSSVEVPKS